MGLLVKAGVPTVAQYLHRQVTLSVARVFASDVVEIEGVGDRAAGFADRAMILLLAGKRVILINGPGWDSAEQAEEVGRLVAAALR